MTAALPDVFEAKLVFYISMLPACAGTVIRPSAEGRVNGH